MINVGDSGVQQQYAGTILSGQYQGSTIGIPYTVANAQQAQNAYGQPQGQDAQAYAQQGYAYPQGYGQQNPGPQSFGPQSFGQPCYRRGGCGSGRL